MKVIADDLEKPIRTDDVSMSSFTDAAFAELAAHKPGDAIPFYEIEGHILELWDQLNELTLEKSLLEAQDTVPLREGKGVHSCSTGTGSLAAPSAAIVDRRGIGFAGEDCGKRVS